MIEVNDTQHSFYMNQMRGKSFSKKSEHVTFEKNRVGTQIYHGDVNE